MSTKPRLLVDTRPIRLSLEEGKDGDKILVRGEFARCGSATENKRIYPKKLWEREIGRLDKPMKDRMVFGEAEHPDSGRTSLNRVSHIVTGMRIEDGILVGEAEVLPTEKGKNLMALLRSGCKIGVSSRGYGSTKANDKGEDIVQDDYRLVTFDFVADPADRNAYPEAFFEGVEINPQTGLTPAQEEKKAKEWAARIQADAKAEEAKAAEEAAENSTDDSTADSTAVEHSKMADEMLAGIASLRGEVREQLKAEFLADPQVAGALTALDKIKSILLPFTSASAPVSESDEIAQLKKDLADKDAKIAELEEENSKLADAAKEAGYKLYMERQIAGDPDASLIRKLVGDVTQLESAEALKTKLSSIREELGNKRSAEENRADNASESKSQKAKTEALEEALEKLTSANKAISLKLYAEKKLQGNPKSAKIRALIENARPSSKESVDSIFESFAPSAPHDSDEASAVRARVRKLTKGGFEAPLEEEVSEKAPPRVEDYNGLGINLGELKRLSGVQRK